MFQKIAKHRANDASNDVHRPPLSISDPLDDDQLERYPSFFFVDLRVFSVQKTGFLPKTGYFRKNVKSLIYLWQPSFTPFPKISSYLSKINKFSDQQKNKIYENLSVFSFDCFLVFK